MCVATMWACRGLKRRNVMREDKKESVEDHIASTEMLSESTGVCD